MLNSSNFEPDVSKALMYPSLFTFSITFCEASVTSLTVRSTACVWQGKAGEPMGILLLKLLSSSVSVSFLHSGGSEISFSC